MAWIRTVDLEDADGRLRDLYAQVVDPRTGQLDNVMKIHSLHPKGLEAHFAVYWASMSPTPGLSVADRETIAVVVSKINGCHY